MGFRMKAVYELFVVPALAGWLRSIPPEGVPDTFLTPLIVRYHVYLMKEFNVGK